MDIENPPTPAEGETSAPQEQKTPEKQETVPHASFHAVSQKYKSAKQENDELREKLSAYESEKAEAEEAALKEKGEYEKLATQRGSELSSLKEKHETIQGERDAYKDALSNQVKLQLESMDEATRELAETLIEGQPVIKHAEILAKLPKTQPAISKNPKPGEGTEPDANEVTKLKEQIDSAKKSGNMSLLLSLKDKLRKLTS